jgi:hypothetical protein
MKLYNTIMSYFWLAVASVSFVTVTYLCFTEGFEKYASNYVFAIIALATFFVKRWMMKRVGNHQQFLKDKSTEKEG